MIEASVCRYEYDHRYIEKDRYNKQNIIQIRMNFYELAGQALTSQFQFEYIINHTLTQSQQHIQNHLQSTTNQLIHKYQTDLTINLQQFGIDLQSFYSITQQYMTTISHLLGSYYLTQKIGDIVKQLNKSITRLFGFVRNHLHQKSKYNQQELTKMREINQKENKCNKCSRFTNASDIYDTKMLLMQGNQFIDPYNMFNNNNGLHGLKPEQQYQYRLQYAQVWANKKTIQNTMQEMEQKIRKRQYTCNNSMIAIQNMEDQIQQIVGEIKKNTDSNINKSVHNFDEKICNLVRSIFVKMNQKTEYYSYQMKKDQQIQVNLLQKPSNKIIELKKQVQKEIKKNQTLLKQITIKDAHILQQNNWKSKFDLDFKRVLVQKNAIQNKMNAMIEKENLHENQFNIFLAERKQNQQKNHKLKEEIYKLSHDNPNIKIVKDNFNEAKFEIVEGVGVGEVDGLGVNEGLKLFSPTKSKELRLRTRNYLDINSNGLSDIDFVQEQKQRYNDEIKVCNNRAYSIIQKINAPINQTIRIYDPSKDSLQEEQDVMIKVFTPSSQFVEKTPISGSDRQNQKKIKKHNASTADGLIEKQKIPMVKQFSLVNTVKNKKLQESDKNIRNNKSSKKQSVTVHLSSLQSTKSRGSKHKSSLAALEEVKMSVEKTKISQFMRSSGRSSALIRINRERRDQKIKQESQKQICFQGMYEYFHKFVEKLIETKFEGLPNFEILKPFLMNSIDSNEDFQAKLKIFVKRQANQLVARLAQFIQNAEKETILKSNYIFNEGLQNDLTSNQHNFIETIRYCSSSVKQKGLQKGNLLEFFLKMRNNQVKKSNSVVKKLEVTSILQSSLQKQGSFVRQRMTELFLGAQNAYRMENQKVVKFGNPKSPKANMDKALPIINCSAATNNQVLQHEKSGEKFLRKHELKFLEILSVLLAKLHQKNKEIYEIVRKCIMYPYSYLQMGRQIYEDRNSQSIGRNTVNIIESKMRTFNFDAKLDRVVLSRSLANLIMLHRQCHNIDKQTWENVNEEKYNLNKNEINLEGKKPNPDPVLKMNRSKILCKHLLEFEKQISHGFVQLNAKRKSSEKQHLIC